MSSSSEIPSSSGFDFGDVVFIVFKHKWKILVLGVIGLAAAGVIHFTTPRKYQSEAKLMVRYVLERNTVDSAESQISSGGGQNAERMINGELTILGSWDLALQVAAAIGPEHLAEGSGTPPSTAEAAKKIVSSLELASYGNVIVASYQDRDPELATTILDKLIANYSVKHLEVHRSVGAHEFVTQQTDQVRSRLRTTEEELKRLKAEAGIVSLAETTAAQSTRINKTQDQILTLQADLAAQTARTAALEKDLAGSTAKAPKDGKKEGSAGTAPPASTTPPEVTQRYQVLVTHLSHSREKELDLLSRYNPENHQVKLIQKEIQDLEKQRGEMSAAYPQLATVATVTGGGAAEIPSRFPDLISERARLIGMQASMTTLQDQLTQLNQQAAKVAAVATEVSDLERRKAVEEANYTLFAASLEKARVDEALDPARMPNISLVQKPTAIGIAKVKTQKITSGIAAGGFALGLIWALLIEMVLRRTVKRPVEVENRLGIPLLATIPQWNDKLPAVKRFRSAWSQERKLLAKGKDNGNSHTTSREINRFVAPYVGLIRDRLILSFELKGLTHKPKLIAVTGLSGGEGTSTLAAGLAASFSQTGEGKVLLVDMNFVSPEIHPYRDGNHVCSLSEAIAPEGDLSSAPISDRLYVATAKEGTEDSTSLAPKRFYNLMPNLRASDFDYIIFDMPPFSESGTTLAISGSMDKVLVIVEADKSRHQPLKRAVTELTLARADLAGIFNKNVSPLPKWLT